jgi:hypothetical protein
MKKLFILFALCINILSVNAQYKKLTLEERSAKFTKEITDYVSNITPEQNTALLEINKIVTMQFDSLKALQLESEEYKPAARNIFKTRDASIKLVLDAKQYDEFSMLQAEKRDASFKKKNEQKLKKEQAKITSTDSLQKTYKKQFIKDATKPAIDSLAK